MNATKTTNPNPKNKTMKNKQIRQLAAAAMPINYEDEGSERQVDAETAFFNAIPEITSDPRWREFQSDKATREEIIEYALELIDDRMKLITRKLEIVEGVTRWLYDLDLASMSYHYDDDPSTIIAEDVDGGRVNLFTEDEAAAMAVAVAAADKLTGDIWADGVMPMPNQIEAFRNSHRALSIDQRDEWQQYNTDYALADDDRVHVWIGGGHIFEGPNEFNLVLDRSEYTAKTREELEGLLFGFLLREGVLDNAGTVHDDEFGVSSDDDDPDEERDGKWTDGGETEDDERSNGPTIY
jgi:hypothetical protein